MGLNLTLDHINVRTANLEIMLGLYDRVMDLKPGARPAFGGAGGGWLYTEENMSDSLDTVKQKYRTTGCRKVRLRPGGHAGRGYGAGQFPRSRRQTYPCRFRAGRDAVGKPIAD